MTQENKKADSVLDFSQAQKNLQTKKENESLEKYYKILSFAELYEETSHCVEQLNKEGATEENLKISKIILKELGSRLEKSQGPSKNFEEMKLDLEKRFLSI